MFGAIRHEPESCCSASRSSVGSRTPTNSPISCTRSWWPRWPPSWALSPTSSTRRSTTTEREAQLGRAKGLSDDAALEATAFPLGQPTPDAEPLIVGQRVLEAPVADLTALADALCL